LRATSIFTVAYEHPGRNGFPSSRIAHGPIAFCDACRERGSNTPRHRSHSLELVETCPQYGQSVPDPPAVEGGDWEVAVSSTVDRRAPGQRMFP
jgi:hypothetical protein